MASAGSGSTSAGGVGSCDAAAAAIFTRSHFAGAPVVLGRETVPAGGSVLRAIVVNAKQVFGPDTVMPGFYTLAVGADVAKAHQGKTILTAQQVEDVVAFLGTLK